jgi:integrase
MTLTFAPNNPTLPFKLKGGMKMLRPRKCWVTWKPQRKRYEVGIWWQGKAEVFYQWEGIPHITQEIAQKHAEQIESELKLHYDRKSPFIFEPQKHKKTPKGKSPYHFSEYSKLWIKGYEQRIKTGDISREYVRNLEGYIRLHLAGRLGTYDIREIRELVIKEVYLSLSEKTFSKKHIQNIMDALKKLFNDAYEEGTISEAVKFPKYKEPKRARELKWQAENLWLSEGDQDQVLEKVPAIHRAIVTTIFYHGIRMAEARLLKRANFNAQEGTIFIETIKGGPPRMILLEPKCLELIKAVPPCLRHQYLFHWKGRRYSKTVLWKVIRKALDDASFREVKPNEAGRHSFGSQRIARGQPTRALQYEMGHSDIRTTEVYTHIKVHEQSKWRRQNTCLQEST